MPATDSSITRRALDRYLDAPSLTRDAMTHYLPEYLKALNADGKSPLTIDAYRKKLNQFAGWMQAEETSFSRRAVTLYLAYLQSTGLRPRTIRASYAAIRGYTRWMESEQLEAPPLDHLRLPRLDQPQRVSPTNEQVATLFAGAKRMPGHTVPARFRKKLTQAVLAVFAFCGIRLTAVLNLKVADYREDKSGGMELHVRKGKGGHSQWVPVNPECAGILAEWLDTRAQALGERPEEALWLNCRHRPLGVRGLVNLWNALLEYAGLTGSGIGRHSMRHWAVSGVAASEGLAAAQAFAGHTNIQTTFNYLHSDPVQVRRAADSLSGRIATATVAPWNNPPKGPKGRLHRRARLT